MPATRARPTQRAYDALAADYDRLTEHHDYELWIGVLTTELARHGATAGRLLDVGCGTGRSTQGWLSAGFDVVGVDASAGMLAQAQSRLPQTRFHHRDLRDLRYLGERPFGLAACLCDVVNYVDPLDLAAAFGSIALQLAPGGLLVFDANTAHAYREHFATTQVVEDADRILIWRGGADERFEPGDSARLVIEAFRDDGGDGTSWRRTTSVHEQFHHPLLSIEGALASAGLALLDVYGQDFDAIPERPLDETRHSKGVFIARRTAAHREAGR